MSIYRSHWLYPELLSADLFSINKKKLKECVSEIETLPVSVITLVLRKIDLRQADYSIFLGVNHPCSYQVASTQILF